MKILGLISSYTDPASRARIIQYKNHFAKLGVSLQPRFFYPLKDSEPPAWSYRIKNITRINEWRSSNFIKTLGRIPLLFSQFDYDIIWQNRLLHSHHYFWETKLRKPVVFDFDDAIWFNEGKEQVIKKIKRSTLIFAGNDYLADFAIKYNKNTVVIPSTIDTEILFPLKKEITHFTIGWIGTKSNFQYLEIVKPAILDFLSQNQNARLIIVTSQKPPQFNFDNNQIIFKPWDIENENEMINEFSVGLMPLEDTDWTRGKCSYKMLQYMACGKPVIVSPVGMNKQLLNAGNIGFAASKINDWLKALFEIKNNPVEASEKGKIGRRIVEDNFSCTKITPQILEYFKSISI